MQLKEIKEILELTGLPVSFNNWPKDKAPAMPYIVFSTEETNPFYADGLVYFLLENIIVYLYTKNKDEKTEQKVDNALLRFPFTKTGACLTEENCWVTTYNFENEV